MTVAAVILAAGASTRMGRSKALIEWQGRPFFMHCRDRATSVGCTPVVVVWGAASLPERAGVRLVENPRWQLGPLSSLQVGLRAIDAPSVSGVLVLTVDRPHVDTSTLLAMIEAHRCEPASVIQPSIDGNRGHPILHPRAVMDALLALEPSDSARTVLRRPEIRAARVSVTVEDPAILDNLDRPEDLVGLVSPRS